MTTHMFTLKYKLKPCAGIKKVYEYCSKYIWGDSIFEGAKRSWMYELNIDWSY